MPGMVQRDLCKRCIAIYKCQSQNNHDNQVHFWDTKVIERAKRAHSLVMTFEISRICVYVYIYVFTYVNGGAI